MWPGYPGKAARTPQEHGQDILEGNLGMPETWPKKPRNVAKAQPGHPGNMTRTRQEHGQDIPRSTAGMPQDHVQDTPKGTIPHTHVVVDRQVLLGELPCPTLGPWLRILLHLVFTLPVQPALVVHKQLRILFFCPFKVGQLRVLFFCPFKVSQLRSYGKSPNINSDGAGRQVQQQALMSLPKFNSVVQEEEETTPI